MTGVSMGFLEICRYLVLLVLEAILPSVVGTPPDRFTAKLVE